MSDPRWQHLQSLFHQALERPEQARSHWLRAACNGDQALFDELSALLAAAEPSEASLEPRPPRPSDPAHPADAPPDRIGPYRILRRIGHGGMGTVYEAEEDRPRRRIALKVMRGGLASPESRRRFEHEAQLLARLQHPGIAKVFGAGTVSLNGEPIEYIAMEFVDGSPLTAFAESSRLSTPDRLELLARIAEAVQHAHQRGVIHRDLKPSNILVSPGGQPTVLDFGIARATDADIRLTRISTGPGPLLGTVPYMSPEQAAGDVAAIDVRSDVYALGVVGYELLTGQPPHESGGGRGGKSGREASGGGGGAGRLLPDLLRAIQEDAPAPLSTFNRSLRGDVETIIATALEKSPDRRYQSAGALADDLRRHLADQPILARPITRTASIVRFARRHSALVTGAAIALIAIVAGGLVAAFLAVQRSAALAEVKAQRDRALAATAVSTETMRWFSEEIITGSDPRRNQNPDISFKEVLDVASSRLPSFGFTTPQARLNAEYSFAEAYRELGELDKALAHARQAEKTAIDNTLEPIERLNSRLNVGRLLNLLGRHDEALATLLPLAGDYRREFGDKCQGAVYADMAIADAYVAQDKLPAAIALLESALPSQIALTGDRHQDVQKARTRLANYYIKERRFDDARPLLEQALEANRALNGNTGQETLNTLNWLAALHRDTGNFPAAERLQREIVAAIRSTTPEGHWIIGAVEANLGYTLHLAGNDAEAVEHLQTGLEILEKSLGPDHPHTRATREKLNAAKTPAGAQR